MENKTDVRYVHLQLYIRLTSANHLSHQILSTKTNTIERLEQPITLFLIMSILG